VYIKDKLANFTTKTNNLLIERDNK